MAIHPNMDSLETESYCSNSSSELGNNCKPRDYSCSSLSNMRGESVQSASSTPNSGKIKLNFGVDRLLSNNDEDCAKAEISKSVLEKSFMFLSTNNNISKITSAHNSEIMNSVNSHVGLNFMQSIHQFPMAAVSNGLFTTNQNFVLKPFPLRIGGNGNQNALDLQQTHQQQHQQSPHFLQTNLRKISIPTSMPNSFPFNSNAFTSMLRIPTSQNPQFNIFNSQKFEKNNLYLNEASKMSQNCSNVSSGSNGHVKRKRSWSRAVFSNLQRKGLERQFEVQKYITKPDRKKLAARLGLKDAQVKVWFQNRRMKWRHTSRGQNVQKLVNGSGNDLTDELEKFTSDESSDEQDEIDVVSDK